MPIPFYYSLFQPFPAYSSIFQPIRANSSLLQPIATYSRQFQPFSANSILFRQIWAYSSLFQLFQVYSILFLHIPAYSRIFQNIPIIPNTVPSRFSNQLLDWGESANLEFGKKSNYIPTIWAGASSHKIGYVRIIRKFIKIARPRKRYNLTKNSCLKKMGSWVKCKPNVMLFW